MFLFLLKGNIFRRRVTGETGLTGSSEGTDFYAWQGYSMTKGHFISLTREDMAVSVPRRNNYFGQINIIRNNNGLDFEGQTLIGTAQVLYILFLTYVHVSKWLPFVYVSLDG